MKSRYYYMIIVILVMLYLTGCSSVNEYVETRVLQRANISEDSDYIEYLGLVKAGEVNDMGLYQENLQSDSQLEDNQSLIHVTFAENSNLKVSYYSDPSFTVPLSTENCYTTPGTVIYATVDKKRGVSEQYEFSGFLIYSYDEEERVLYDELTTDFVSTGIVVEIPRDFTGDNLAIEPRGEFVYREIKFHDYYLVESEQKDVVGNWKINDIDAQGDKGVVSPFGSYIVSYEYDPEEYFFISSVPECFYNDNQSGLVIFEERQGIDEVVDYEVQLQKYITVSLVSNSDRNVSVNGGAMGRLSANTELNISHLKYGDVVTLLTSSKWDDLETNRELIMTEEEPQDSGYYKYTLIVPQKDGEFLFNPSDYSYEHGTISFKCFGSAVTAPQKLAKGTKIFYSQATADEGYWLPGENLFITVGDEEETRTQLEAIHFVQMVKTKVYLPQPEYGGHIEYELNDEIIESDQVDAYTGNEIKLYFIPWDGWYTNYKNGKIYTVTQGSIQTISLFDGNEPIFREDEAHQPLLTVTLEKSVGDNMVFTIRADGYDQEIKSYNGEWSVKDVFDGSVNPINSDQTIIRDHRIGTREGIVIDVSNRALQSNQACRIKTVMKDTEGNERILINYITNTSEPNQPINIYEPDAVVTRSIPAPWYETIHIAIGVVDVSYFRSSSTVNARIEVKNADTLELLNDDDPVEDSQKVVVSIRPSTGYYLTGDDIQYDMYQQVMTYADYVKNIETIINEHPAEKFYTIELDSSDSFATYTYRLDGNIISGTVRVKLGQKLELTYEITDSVHKLKEAEGSFLGIGGTDKTAVREITITSDLDGQLITKETFGIEVISGE